MGAEVQRSVEMLQTVVNKAAELLISYGFEVLGALVVLFLGFKLSRWAANLSLQFLKRKGVDVTVARFVGGAVRGLILGFALIVALGKFGITIAPIIAAVGAIAFGGTFALQGTLANMGSGLSLLFFRPFAVGDTITVAGVSGVVEEVKLGATIVTNEDGERITVPNRHIVGQVVRNSFTYRRAEVVVGISYADDPERAIEVFKTTLEQTADVAKTPAPIVGIREFGESSINIGLRYWVPTTRYLQVASAINVARYEERKHAVVTIPCAQRDVHVISRQQ